MGKHISVSVYIYTHKCLYLSPFVNLTCKSHGKNVKAVPLRVGLHLLQILKGGSGGQTLGDAGELGSGCVSLMGEF